MKKRKWVRFALIAGEVLTLGLMVLLVALGQGNTAFILLFPAAALALLIVRSVRGGADAQALARVEKVYGAYLSDVFAQDARHRRELLVVLHDTLLPKPPACSGRFLSLLKAATTPHERAVLSFFAARACTHEGKNERAEELYRAAVQEEETLSSAWSNLGVLLQVEGRHTEAEECLLRALAYDPDNAVKRTNLANLYVVMHRPQEAREQAKRALEKNDRLPEAYLILAICAAMEKNRAEANRYVEKCVSLGMDRARLTATVSAVLRGDESVLAVRESARTGGGKKKK